jgi:hypothetical protein
MSIARTGRWNSSALFAGIAMQHRVAQFRHNSTDEYPVSANATTGNAELWPNPTADHNAVTLSVNIIGSRKSQTKPKLSRPNRVITSHINSAEITRPCTRRARKND